MILPVIERWARPLLQAHGRLVRGGTLGVRGLAQDVEGRILLVRHTYVHGWYFPGGGVERGETADAGLARELVEEAGVEPIGRPTLLSVHSNHQQHPGDQVLFYRIGAWRRVPATSRGEIAAVEWFAPDALPQDATAATRRRVAEVFGSDAPDPLW